MTDKTQEELEEILHLVGCQCHAQGWNDKLDGKDNFDLTEVERLEKLALEEVTHYINKYYVPRDEVKKIIGEDEPIADTPTHPVVSYEALHRNQLRAEQREKLKSIRREKR